MPKTPEPDFIDDLLREDERQLRARKTRLRAFQGALDSFRAASAALSDAGQLLIESADINRTDAAKVFQLTRLERATAFPARQTSTTDTVNQPTHTADNPDDNVHEEDQHLSN